MRNVYPLVFLDGPLPEVKPHVTSLHDNRTQIHDPLHYMQDLHDSDTLAYIRSEQKHFGLIESKFDLKHARGRLWAELDAKIVVTSREGGFDKGEERIGDYVYFTRVVPGNDPNAIGFYRKKFGQVDLLGEELINPLALQQHFGYRTCSIGVCRVSEDQRYLAYTLSIEGGDRYICHVRSIDNASLFHVIRGRNIVGIEFGSSNYLFYTESNELNRPCCVMMQEIRPGILPSPTSIYHDEDERFFVDVRKTKDNAFLTITSDGKSEGSVWVIPASYPVIPHPLRSLFPADAGPVELMGKCGGWNWLEHYHDHFIRVTSDHGPNFRVVYLRDEVALKHREQAEWKELVPHRADVQIADVDIFEGRLVLYETHFSFDRIHHIRIVRLDDEATASAQKEQDKDKDDSNSSSNDEKKEETHHFREESTAERMKRLHVLDQAAQRSRQEDVLLHFPPLSVVTPGLNKNFHQSSMSFMYSSITQPSRDCVFSFRSTLTAAQARRAPPESLFTQRQSEQFTPWDYMWPYTLYRDICTSADGAVVPLTICQRRDAFVHEATDFEEPPNHPRHCLIYVYGAYGEVPAMHFQLAPYLWLLRRRWTVVFAHVRGGGECPGWASQGRHAHKTQSVDDLIACCEHVVQMGYTTPDKLVALGSSAGCVPIAAAMNQRGSDLFGTALMRSPFLDVVHTMLDTSLPLSVAEQQDWGNPRACASEATMMQKYDPYSNVNDRVVYPAMFISACLDDERVPAWNALKYVAKLRQQRRRQGVDPVERPLVLRLRSRGGHGYWNSMEQICDELAFLCSQLDVEGAGKALNDMDMMTHMHNLTATGMMDHDDQQKVFLKWDNWERERIDYYMKLNRFDWEPNFRKIKAEKEPFFWVPNEEELDQHKVDAMFAARARDGRERDRADGVHTGSCGKPVGRNYCNAQQHGTSP